MNFKRLTDIDVRGKKVFIRADLNVPQDDAGAITDDTRIRASVPGIKDALARGAAVMVTSHLGRPTEGEWKAEDSMAPIAKRLGELLGMDVPLVQDWVGGGAWHEALEPGQVVLLENCRFNKGEKKNVEATARKYAALCDLFVMDAFGTAHRAEGTTYGIAQYAPAACAGLLVAEELDALSKALLNPARPMVAIVGGSKVSTKLTVLESLSEKVDQLVVGGGIANTFLLARGKPIGKSLAEPDMVEIANRLLAQSAAKGVEIPLPTDVVVGKEFSPKAEADVKSVADVLPDDMILDIGPDTAERLARIVGEAGTIVWNGPVGVFEIDQFGEGTKTLANAIARSKAFSLAGGGDTLAAIEKYGVEDGISYISTGGGAFLEFVEGKVLPAVAMLQQRAGG